MDQNYGEKRNILLVNGLNYLGRSLIDYMAALQLPYMLYVVEQTIDQKLASAYALNPSIKILNTTDFFKTLNDQLSFDVIIYNALYEQGSSSAFFDNLANYKLLISKSLTDNSNFNLLIPITPTQPQEYIQSLTSLTQEFITNHLNAHIINVGEVYGPGMDLKQKTYLKGTSPFIDLINHAVNDSKIILEQDNTFSYYIYCNDAVDGIVKAMNIAQAGTFTLADPFDVSLVSLATRIGELTGKEVVNKTKPQPQDHLKSLPYIVPGWKPSKTIEQGLEDTFSWIHSSRADAPQIHSIASDTTDTPIRNYQPSAFKDPTEEISFNDSAAFTRQRKNVGNLDQVKKQMGIEEEEKKHFSLPHLKNPFSFISQSRERASGATESLASKKLFFLVIIAVIILIIYIGVISPVVIICYSYSKIGNDLQQFSLNKTSDLETQTTNLANSFSSLSWAFSLAHQQTRYSNFEQTIATLKDFADTQVSYYDFITPYTTFIKSFEKQQSINPTYTDAAALYGNTHEDIVLAQSDLGAYTPFLPASTQRMASVLQKEGNTIQSMFLKYKIISDVLTTNSTYIVVIGNTSTPFSSSSASSIGYISFKNGLYQGVTTLAIPKNISSQTFTQFAQTIEASYSVQSNGVIMINKSTAGSLDINNLTTALISGQVPISQFKSAITQNNVLFYLNNQLLTKDDIIGALINSFDER